MRDLISAITGPLARGEALALATLVSRNGSAPRDRGARLLASATGLVAGTVGGGAAEAAVLDACAAVLRDGTCRLFDLTLTNALAAQEGMVCGGSVRVFVEPLRPDGQTRDFFAAVEAALRDGDGVLLTKLASGPEATPERTLYAARTFTGAPLDEEAARNVLEGRGPLPESSVLPLNGAEYFAEPLLPPSRMLIAGGGHVAVPTAELAAFAGFTVHVVDDRPEFARPERFPQAASVSAMPAFADCLAPFAPDARTCVVIVTRGHLYDETVLAQALRTNAGYIGMIGSRKKRDAVYEALRTQGFSDADLARVHCPVGLDIGAETPAEIAVSILAECIAHKRTAHGRS